MPRSAIRLIPRATEIYQLSQQGTKTGRAVATIRPATATATVQLTNKNGWPVPNASNQLAFGVEGPGEIVTTDNGDAANMTSFASPVREAFNGKCLVIIRGRKGQPGTVKLRARSGNLAAATVAIKTTAEK